MKCFLFSIALTAIIVSGCGPSASELRERTLSLLNTEADRWDGGKDFATSAVDPYGQPLTGQVEKGVIYNVLEVRSNGPDALPKNNDDIVVTRSKNHGEFSITENVKKGTAAVSSGMVSGAIEGTKEGLGFGRWRKAKDSKPEEVEITESEEAP